MNEVSVPYYCPHCESDTTLIVQANGPNDYISMNEYCPNCNACIEGGDVDTLIYDAINNYFQGQGEFYHDYDLE